MLELKNIVKVYPSGGENIQALKGVSLAFRNSEFVSILGPSGCGKTTTLNIIGGLDQYTEGDLIINGRSTREYKDRDWDTYRNHSIGFVFQSYNLIPHQTVLSNVELALTLSGVGKRERKERAKKALEAVGLGNQLKKRPAQMSGGQMQRVALARAIVNDPDIILADEPTGALDSETSIQVMDILKEIAKDRLVIMVTHNPELAEQYSTRIVRMLDGTVREDSMPIGEEEMEQLRREDAAAEAAGSRKAAQAAAAAAVTAGVGSMGSSAAAEGSGPKASQAAAGASTDRSGRASAPKGRKKKASMSLFTAFGLSLNNLFTKKGRTLLTSFAGSIGIIGIALIYAVSQGTSDYIDTVQEDTLASYPLTISAESADFTAMLSGFVTATQAAEEERTEQTVIEQPVMASMFEGVGTNDLKSLKAYLDDHTAELASDVNSISYTYGVTPRLYTVDVNGELLQANPSRMMSYMGMSDSMSSMYSSYGFSLFSEMVGSSDQLDEQYEVLAGTWPKEWNEMVLVLSSKGKITDMLTYAIGLHDPNELEEMMKAVMSGETPEVKNEKSLTWTYDDLLNLNFRLVGSYALYRHDTTHGVWEDMSGDEDYMRQVWENGVPIRVCGVVCAKDSTSSLLSVGFNYLPSLTQYVMTDAADSEIVKMQLADETVNVFSGKPFGEEDSDTGLDFGDMINIDTDALGSAFNIDLDEDAVMALLNVYMNQLLDDGLVDNTVAVLDFAECFRSLGSGMLNEMAAKGDGTANLTIAGAETAVDEYLAGEEAQSLLNALAEQYDMDPADLQTVMRPLLTTMISSYVVENMETDPEPETPEEPQTDPEEASEPEFEPEEGEGASTGENEAAAETFAAEPWTEPAEETAAELSGEASEENGEAGTGEEDPDPEPVPSTDPEEPSVDPGSVMDNVRNTSVPLPADEVDRVVNEFAEGALVNAAAAAMSTSMLQPEIEAQLSDRAQDFLLDLMRQIMGSMNVNEEAMAEAFQFNMTEEDMTRLITALSGQSSASGASENLLNLGYADEADPEAIYVYLKDFEAKERFKTFLENYNDLVTEAGEEEKAVQYTDITGILMSSVTTIINAVTYVLIAFVAISLIVSSIMIGVITLISVQERTKEIGILRAIGASKRNVSSMFNAETVIIGFSSGLIGVLVTYLFCIPINLILHKLTGISYLSAKLPLPVALILIAISMFLTLIAGIIPSRSAAKKDPVIALRSE